MVETCELEVPRQELLECPPCIEIFFDRVTQVNLARLSVVVIRRYLLRKCFVGLAMGQHVHSLTLLPKEELEIEIVQRSKFSRALHEQRSVESEFRFELQSTARDEWSSEEEINWKVGGGVDFEIFGIGAKSSGEYSEREKTAEKHFREVISKTSSKVSQKFDVAIDTKTEVENQYRSVRKITNPNPCQPVIYNYFQLAKKYKSELILTDIRFDFIPPQLPTPPVLKERLSEVVFRAQRPYRQNLDLNIVAPPPSWTLATKIAGATTQMGLEQVSTSLQGLQSLALPISSRFLSAQTLAQPVSPQIASPVVSIAALPPVRVPVEPPDVKRLTKEELLQLVRSARPGIIDRFSQELDQFLKEDVNQIGVRDSYEYCINTGGLYVETSLSKCSACDEFTLELRRLEIEKAKLEIELMKKKNDGSSEADSTKHTH